MNESMNFTISMSLCVSFDILQTSGRISPAISSMPTVVFAITFK